MSRAAGAPDGATGTGTTTASACGRGASARPPSLHGTSSGAAAKRRASTGRCQTPWRPGRLPAAGASKRIAPARRAQQRRRGGRVQDARGVCSRDRRARRAAGGQRPGELDRRERPPLRAGGRRRRHPRAAPARRSEAASSASASRSPAVPPRETMRTSTPAMDVAFSRPMRPDRPARAARRLPPRRHRAHPVLGAGAARVVRLGHPHAGRAVDRLPRRGGAAGRRGGVRLARAEAARADPVRPDRRAGLARRAAGRGGHPDLRRLDLRHRLRAGQRGATWSARWPRSTRRRAGRRRVVLRLAVRAPRSASAAPSAPATACSSPAPARWCPAAAAPRGRWRRRGAPGRSSSPRSARPARPPPTSSAPAPSSRPHADADGAMAAHAELFEDVRPASTMLLVHSLLDPRWTVEVEAEARARSVGSRRRSPACGPAGSASSGDVRST